MYKKGIFDKISQIEDVKEYVPEKWPKGSLTLEAALVLPLFLLFFIAVISLLSCINVQLGIQVGMEEASRSMGKIAYIIEEAEDVLDGPKEGNEESKETLDENEKTLMEAGINPLSIKVWLMADPTLRNVVNGSRIMGGTAGLYTHESTFDEDKDILDMVVHYDYSVPWLPKFWGTLRFVQRVYSHVWTGEELDKKGGDGEEEESTTVYITPTGTVYHTSPSCHYLDLSIHTVAASMVNVERNESGGRYECCSACARGVVTDTYYITDYGNNYHASLGCSGLKRTVIAIDIKDVGSRRVCSKCGGK